MHAKTKDRLMTAGTLLLIAAGSISFPGCTLTPHCEGDLACELRDGTEYFAEYQHVSHLSAGWPFGPSREEDSLDHLSLCAARNAGILLTEICYGYMPVDGGFYGPHDTLTLRVRAPLSIFKGKFE